MDDRTRRAMSPTREEIAALKAGSNGAAARELLANASGSALDVGCGDGKFTRALAGIFAAVAGVDIKEKQIAAAKDSAIAAGLTIDFRVASGENLPWPDATFDVVSFSNSLHHMPDPAVALREAGRVLKGSGLLYVMEPVPAGNYHDATVLVNDETIVRTIAYAEVRKLTTMGYTGRDEVMYSGTREFADFEEWRADQIDRDVKRKALFDQRPEEVKRVFESNADRANGRLVFTQVFRVNVLIKTP